MGEIIDVAEQGRRVAFSYDEMLRYSGPDNPGGVALGFKLMERAFTLLEPGGLVERREVAISTAFPGPGARDACELVTRAATEGRYTVDPGLARPERGRALRLFAFDVAHGAARVALLLREGFVTDEFWALAEAADLGPADRARFAAMKRDLAGRLMATEVAGVFESG